MDKIQEIKEMQEEMFVEFSQRKNDFCIISKDANENGWHDLQKNSGWSSNPKPEEFVVVPDDMVEEIWETKGYCNIVLNKDETEVVSFTPTEIPYIPVPEPKPTKEEKRIAELEEQLLLADETAVALYESQLAQEEINIAQDEALVELYEMLGGM